MFNSDKPISALTSILDFIHSSEVATTQQTDSVSSSQTVDLVFALFYFSFLFFLFKLVFYFLFLEQLGLGLIGHAVTSVTTWWHNHKTDHETGENMVEDSRTNNDIQHRSHMLILYSTLARQGKLSHLVVSKPTGVF